MTMADDDAFGITPFSLKHEHASDKTNDRLRHVANAFYAHFHRYPKAIVRAPGRVNLIGEHIDYEGYGVLPMAIDHDVCIAFDDALEPMNESFAVTLTNTQCNNYHAIQLTNPTILSTTSLQWSDYFLCGYRGMMDFHPTWRDQSFQVDALVDGSIPAACGLSSSSAFVVASAILTAYQLHQYPNDLPSRHQVAEICRMAEQYIGTIGGGMDQAASCLSREGFAQRIEFDPLRTQLVEIPKALDVVFVVCNSMVKAEKAVDAVTHFNKRVIECAFATKWIAKALGLTTWKQLYRLADLQKAYGEMMGTQVSLASLKEIVERLLTSQEYSTDQLEENLGSPLHDSFQGTRIAAAAERVLKAASTFKLRQRALHVLSESARVDAFEAICTGFGASSAVENTRQHLGQLMLESHISCRDAYECSCPALDRLVKSAMDAGAFGARLTGAGWGGCAIALVANDHLESFLSQLNASYYQPHGLLTDNAVFVSVPAAGAAMFQVISTN